MDVYYQLVDRDTSTVKACWKVLHLISFIIVIISGFTTSYVLGRSFVAFGENCVLFANIKFIEHGHNATKKPLMYGLREVPGNLTTIHIAASDWGSIHLCYFCQFAPLISMISAVIWSAFFIMCSKGGAGYVTDTVYRPWKLVYPVLFFTVIATIVMLISTLKLHEGVAFFCARFEKQFGTKRCTSAIDDYTLSFSKTKKRFIVFLKLAVYCSYICLAGWVLQLATLLLRIANIVDFQLIKITVIPITAKEMVQKIIDPDAKSLDTLLSSIVAKESIDVSKSGRRFPFLKNRFGFGQKKKTLTPADLEQGTDTSTPTATTIAVVPKPFESPNTPEMHRVSFIDESPTTEDTDTVKNEAHLPLPQKKTNKIKTLNNTSPTLTSVPSTALSNDQSTSSSKDNTKQLNFSNSLTGTYWKTGNVLTLTYPKEIKTDQTDIHQT